MTLKFNAARLKEARLLRGLTQTELADMVDVTKQAVSQYENGIVIPRGDVEIAMAQALNMPLAYFSMADSDLIRTPIFFRSRKSATNKKTIPYKVYINWTVDIYNYIANLVKLPKVNLINKCQEQYSLDDIIVIAKELRKNWGLGGGPISNLTLLMENNGFIIAKTPLKADRVDACSLYFTNKQTKKNRPMVFLTASTSSVRSRRDLAHELGHQVLHSWMSEDEFEQNKARIEDEAELFASCFLMPFEAMEREVFSVTSTDSLLYMKRRWGTSAQSILYHLHNLGLIKDTVFEGLRGNIYRRKWRKHEPFDDDIAQEHPELIKDAICLIVDAGLKSPREIQEELSFPVKDLAELCGLPKDFFEDMAFKKPMLRIIK